MPDLSTTADLTTLANETVDVSLKGKWFKAPAFHIQGKNIIVNGQWIKTAVIHEEEWLETEVADPALCVKTLKKQRVGGQRADIFSFAQKLPATQPKYPYPMEWDSIAAIRIRTFKEWWESVPQETRKNVRRSQKRGVVVEVRELNDRLIQDLIDLNNDAPVRQGKPFTHFGKAFDQVVKDQASFLDRSDYICAYAGEELIGVLKLVCRGDVASILTFLSKKSQQDKRPANALIAKAVELCEQKKMSHLIFGMFNYGNKRDTSLREFKIRHGFGEILVPHFFVPLTAKGTICVKLKIHRGLLGILPHGVITVLIGARAKWQQFKMSRCSSMLEPPNSNRQMGRSNPPAGSNL
jgi:hypothetical protein